MNFRRSVRASSRCRSVTTGVFSSPHSLIDHGVDLVVGSHPHSIQPLDSDHGRPIVYSLGNLVFDGAPTVPTWNKGNLLEIGFGRGGAPTLRLIPFTLDRRGVPHAEQPRETAQR